MAERFTFSTATLINRGTLVGVATPMGQAACTIRGKLAGLIVIPSLATRCFTG
jgi:hypothetical protein